MKIPQIQEQVVRKNILILLVIFLSSYLFLSFIKPPSPDWINHFSNVAKAPFQPYGQERYFYNPPWTALILFPFSLLPLGVAWKINACFNIVIFSGIILFRKGNLLSIFLTLTSLPFFWLIGNGNIEWIPALALFFPNSLGLILLSAKPQSGILVGLAWIKKQENLYRFVGIPVLWFLFSLLIWKNWPIDLFNNLSYSINRSMQSWNLSLFPWTVPIGIYLIYHILKNKPENGELLGALATLCISPYFAAYSLILFFTLLSISYPRYSILVWLSLWAYFFIVNLI